MRHVPEHIAGPGVRVVDYGIRGMHLAYDLLDGYDTLVLVDALPNRGVPGTVHVFEADHESLSAATGLAAPWLLTATPRPACAPHRPTMVPGGGSREPQRTRRDPALHRGDRL